VVSARTPARLDQIKQNQHIHQQQQQQQQHQPYQSSPKSYINQSQPPPPKQYPGLSLSHRIETTSTPLQIPISSTSLRNGGNQLLPNSTPLRQASLNKDGATDV
jgi:hemolysin activation/secretion protein